MSRAIARPPEASNGTCSSSETEEISFVSFALAASTLSIALMDLILALDTSTEICSVALGRTDDYVEISRKIPKQHNQFVLPMIDSLFEVTDWERSELACVAFSAGPGSFTGIRMSASVAQGVALALGVRAYPIPSALVLARSISTTLHLTGLLQVARRSRQDLFYVANVKVDATACKLSNTEDLLQEGSIDRGANHFIDRDWNVSSRDVLTLAELNRSEWVEAEDALPFYIESDSPWTKSG